MNLCKVCNFYSRRFSSFYSFFAFNVWSERVMKKLRLCPSACFRFRNYNRFGLNVVGLSYNFNFLRFCSLDCNALRICRYKCFGGIYCSSEEEGSMFLRNIGIYLQVHTVLQPKRPTLASPVHTHNFTYDIKFNMQRIINYRCQTSK
jgi:hypothetical protein